MSDKLYDMCSIPAVVKNRLFCAESVYNRAAAISHFYIFFAKCAAEFFEPTAEHSASIPRTPQQLNLTQLYLTHKNIHVEQ